LDELDELDVADPGSVPGVDVVADDSEEVLAGGGGGVVVVVDSLRVVESMRVSGEADGDTRSRSAPPTRSLLSVQPASTPTPRARTQKPVSNFFIVVPPSWIRIRREGLQRRCRQRAACGTLVQAITPLKESSQ
jgi:hypothetical protein